MDPARAKTNRPWLGFAQKPTHSSIADEAAEAEYLVTQINRLLSEDKNRGTASEQVCLYLGQTGQALDGLVRDARTSNKPVTWIQCDEGDEGREVYSQRKHRISF